MNKNFAFDRTLTLGMLMTLAVQTASGLVWAGGIQTRITQLEVNSQQTLPINIRLTRLEEQVSAAQATLDRIETEISRRPGQSYD